MSALNTRLASLTPEQRALLERRLQSQKAPLLERIEARADSTHLPSLSFAQQRLWFLDQLEPGLAFYNLPLVFSLSGPISVRRLEQSLNEIVRRHEVLRTTFSADGGQAVQVIHREMRIALLVIDLTDQPPEDRELEASRLTAVEALAPFDLEQDSMLRAKLLKIDDGRHVMLLTMHHIASDGWSMGVLFRELSALYEAYCAGKSSPLPPLPIQYADFAVWQKQYLSGARLEKLLSYWRGKLAGAAPVIDFPTDHPRPTIQRFQGAAYAVTIPQRLIEGLKRIARSSDATLFMALLAAFKVLLFRYSGSTDLVIGSPTANRTRFEVENLIGFFVNPLLLRTDLSGDPSFLEVLSRVREVTLDAYAHQDLPFERLVEEIQPERSLSHNPLFQIMFVLQNTEKNLAAGSANQSPQFRAGTSKFDLTLSALETTDGLTALFEYDAHLFDQTTVSAMAENFEALLASINAQPNKPISNFLILDEHQRRQLLERSAAMKVVPPEDHLVHGIFETRVRQSPDRIALEFLGEKLSYGEVNQRANRLARALRQRGVETGGLVGLCMERSFEAIVSLLAIMKAGAAYLPLDPIYPIERLEHMLSDSGTHRVLTTEQLRTRLPSQLRDVIYLDSLGETLLAFSDEDLLLAPPAEIACVIYTSGSSGGPKGVEVAHSGLCNSAEAQARILPVDGDFRILQFASMNFDASLFEMMMAWRNGATLCLAPQQDLLPGYPLVKLLEEQRINALTIPPSALEVAPTIPLPDLSLLVVGGEVCPANLVSRWLTGRRMFNVYGPTEASIWCTFAECQDSGLAPPIGKPILNMSAYVLDPAREPVLAGVPGELYISGPGVARGYLNRPALTAERFLPDPFSANAMARMYKTGDRARLLADGQIQFLGRIDRQVKLRGYRIELGEIEEAILLHPDIVGAAVDVHESTGGNPFLVSYFVEQKDHCVDSADLRDFLRRRLPEYMLPTSFQRLETLPLNGSGKLDRHALQRCYARMAETADTPWTPPSNPTEALIAEVWVSVLEINAVGIHQKFFDLGGHSLLATRVASRLCKVFALDVPLRAIFEHQTIAELARFIEILQAAPAENNEIEFVSLSRKLVEIPNNAAFD